MGRELLSIAQSNLPMRAAVFPLAYRFQNQKRIQTLHAGKTTFPAQQQTMPIDEPSETEQLLRGELLQSLSVFGNLLTVSALRDFVTGRYKHELANRLPDGGDSILRRIHQQVFIEWLSLSLEKRELDILVWIKSQGVELGQSIKMLRNLESHAVLLIPPTCRNHERKLFLLDLRIVLERVIE